MPGNYRPFKEDASSYKKTGIPCGNPSRYQSRAVIKMCPLTGRYDTNLEAPIEDIETEGDRQLKVLLKRQLNTDVTLEEQLAKKRAFTEPVVYNALGTEVAGPKALEEFISKEKERCRVDELRQFGLTEEEIQLKLKAACTGTSQKTKGYGAHPAAIAEKLKIIDGKIEAHQQMLSKPVSFTGTKSMTRHEMDLELAITHNKEKARLCGSLLTEGNSLDPSYEDKSHPINHLDSILEEALAKRRKNNNKKLDDSAADSIVEDAYAKSQKEDNQNLDNSAVECHSQKKVYSDVDSFKETAAIDTDCNETLEPMPEATCQPKPKVIKKSNTFIYLPDTADSSPVTQTKDNIMNSPHCLEGEIRKLHGRVDTIPEEAICRYRLSIEEIKKLDHFASYEPGVQTNKLFLKNLSSKVTELDLVSLFHRFQRHTPIQYRLMSGRMKGQAFITLDSEEIATEALKLINGYHFKGKPIIIQYGKH